VVRESPGGRKILTLKTTSEALGESREGPGGGIHQSEGGLDARLANRRSTVIDKAVRNWR
jgi:hypothetical protein